jgi:uncharacterized protein (TIGR02246 family)
MKKYLLFAGLTIVSINTAFCQSDEKANILAVEKNTADAFTKHNIPALTSVFADDVSIVTQNGDVINKQQLLQYVQRVNSVTLSNLNVKIFGNNNFAVVTGMETETGKDDSGSAYTNKIRFTDVLEKRKGQWVIVASQATLLPQ